RSPRGVPLRAGVLPCRRRHQHARRRSGARRVPPRMAAPDMTTADRSDASPPAWRWLQQASALLLYAALAVALLWPAVGGYEVVFLQHPHTNVSMLLPLLILAADAVAQRPTATRVAGLALVAGLQHLGGHAETTFHCQFAALALGAARCLSLRHERATGSM